MSAELPKFIVILIGLSLFSIELLTFGGGEYAASYIPLVVGSSIIVIIVWFLNLKDKQKKKQKAKLNNSKNSTINLDNTQIYDNDQTKIY